MDLQQGVKSEEVENDLCADRCFKSGLFYSKIPDRCVQDKREYGPEVIMGIDEAGRGPVLGPMVYGASYWLFDDDSAVKAMGFDDSKALSEVQREKLYKKICEESRIGWILRVIGSKELSAKMLRRDPCSLNVISHEAAMEMIRHILSKGVNLSHVYVDTVGDPSAYSRILSKEFPSINFTVAKKADSLYKTVSAASICAKVTRDRILANWRFSEIGLSDHAYGSGYPADPQCVSWLKQNSNAIFGYPNIVRFSWSTTKEALACNNAVQVDWKENENLETGTQRLDTFFSQNAEVSRTNYFKRARLNRVSKF